MSDQADKELIDQAFLAVMNSNDGLPLTAWAERNKLKRQIATAFYSLKAALAPRR